MLLMIKVRALAKHVSWLVLQEQARVVPWRLHSCTREVSLVMASNLLPMMLGFELRVSSRD